jgi:hypothetical protein
MEGSKIIFVVYGFFSLITLGFLIYFLIQRLKKEKSEDFEQRDN